MHLWFEDFLGCRLVGGAEECPGTSLSDRMARTASGIVTNIVVLWWRSKDMPFGP
jgi:hypothetical protein